MRCQGLSKMLLLETSEEKDFKMGDFFVLSNAAICHTEQSFTCLYQYDYQIISDVL